MDKYNSSFLLVISKFNEDGLFLSSSFLLMIRVSSMGTFSSLFHFHVGSSEWIYGACSLPFSSFLFVIRIHFIAMFFILFHFPLGNHSKSYGERLLHFFCFLLLRKVNPMESFLLFSSFLLVIWVNPMMNVLHACIVFYC